MPKKSTMFWRQTIPKSSDNIKTALKVSHLYHLNEENIKIKQLALRQLFQISVSKQFLKLFIFFLRMHPLVQSNYILKKFWPKNLQNPFSST